MSGEIWIANDAANATQGTCTGGWSVDSVVIDSRKAKEGSLFVALQGPNHDAHNYVLGALEQGATAAMVHRVPEGMQNDDPRLLVVADTMDGLVALGIAARARMQGRVIGVTGSVGKTSTKEALRVCLEALGEVHATAGNYNNHIGVPLTLANMSACTDYAIIEMGMSAAGEISALTKMARPHVAMITAVEAAHMEFFDSVHDVANAKLEIIDGLEGGGVLILPADNAYYSYMRERAAASDLVTRVESFGVAEDADCRMQEYFVELLGSRVEAMVHDVAISYEIGAVGAHWGCVTLSALAVVDVLGADLPLAAQALVQFVEPEGRGRITLLTLAGETPRVIRLIDDSYNASPASMQAAFAKLGLIVGALKNGFGARGAAEEQQVRAVAVLGDMLEMGDDSPEQHGALAPAMIDAGIDKLFAAGQDMRRLYEAVPESVQGAWAQTAGTLQETLCSELRAGDVVLIKGSHGSKMYELVAALKALAQD